MHGLLALIALTASWGNAPLDRRGQAAPRPLIAVDQHVLGYQSGQRWVRVDHTFAARLRPTLFTPITLGKIGKSFGPVKFSGEEVDGGCYIESSRAAANVNVSVLKPKILRKIEFARPSASDRKIVQDYLKTIKLGKMRARVVRVIRVDLDGDKTVETIIEARNRDDIDKPRFPKFENYSLVLLSCIRRGSPRLIRLEGTGGSLHDIELNRLRAVADLDGDGRMEIVTDGQGYEWSHGTLWRYRFGVATELLVSGRGV